MTGRPDPGGRQQTIEHPPGRGTAVIVTKVMIGRFVPQWRTITTRLW
jgi:hypothetical protein